MYLYKNNGAKMTKKAMAPANTIIVILIARKLRDEMVENLRLIACCTPFSRSCSPVLMSEIRVLTFSSRWASIGVISGGLLSGEPALASLARFLSLPRLSSMSLTMGIISSGPSFCTLLCTLIKLSLKSWIRDIRDW